jgi:hypothetical protein
VSSETCRSLRAPSPVAILTSCGRRAAWELPPLYERLAALTVEGGLANPPHGYRLTGRGAAHDNQVDAPTSRFGFPHLLGGPGGGSENAPGTPEVASCPVPLFDRRPSSMPI